MNEQCEARSSGRKNGIWRKTEAVSNMTDSRNNSAQDVSTTNKQDEIGPEKLSDIFQAATTVDYSGRIIPQNNSQHQLKGYSRTQSESNVSLQARSNTAKLQRALSATELRTRLAGCPQGLLIATEPPTSGETYRRRSNTDVKTILGKKNLTASSSEHHLVRDGLYHKNINSQQVTWGCKYFLIYLRLETNTF